MIKVVLLLEDRDFSNVCFSDVKQGNPGVGGTEYEIALLGVMLSENTDINVAILHYNKTNVFPETVSCILSSEDYIWEQLTENDIFIFRNGRDARWYEKLEKTKVRGICWAHNFLSYSELNCAEKCPALKRIVCVGKQEYEHYIDHSAIRKMTYIYNMLGNTVDISERAQMYGNEVTYTGSLIPVKGFHILAKHWKKIVDVIPDARLNVIGSGKLYSRNAQFGEYGIADAEYEKEFMPFILDGDGNLLESVTFHGLVGKEKEQIYRQTAVGIENPSAETETFGISGAEMAVMGIPIVTKAKNGFLDTVPHGVAGWLFENEDQFPELIIRLLQNHAENNRLGRSAREYIRENFLPEKILPEWVQCFEEIEAEQAPKVCLPDSYMEKDCKKLRVFLYKCHENKVLKWMPSIHAWENALYNAKQVIKKAIRRK